MDENIYQIAEQIVRYTSESLRGLYIYKDDNAVWPQHDNPESDYQWVKDYDNGHCKKFNLSKRNLLLAFENVLQRL